MNGIAPEADGTLSAADLLLFDFRSPEGDHDAGVQRERVRSLLPAGPFLVVVHLIWAAALSRFLAGSDSASALLPLLGGIGAVLALDVGLWVLSRRCAAGAFQPHLMPRFAALYTVAACGPWLFAIRAAAATPAGSSIALQAALLAGIGAVIPAFFPVPGLLLLACAATLGGFAMMTQQSDLVLVGAGMTASMLLLSLFRARIAIVDTFRRIAADWQAEKALRFVADFEESGRGWFWETNADGALTHVSDELARHLKTGGQALVGRPFAELLLLGDENGGAKEDLGFHLSARFPFSELSVRANSAADIWWSLSGSPSFDQYGRFLGFRGIGTNLTARRKSEAEISKLAKYDSLTGLANRAMMRLTLDEALANAESRRKGCSLMLIDLDRFKQVNDTLGHPVGDVLLKKVAERLRKVVGDDGQIGRLGGDEFEAILPGADQEPQLAALAQRLIDEVSKPYSIQGHRISIGASVGIAIAVPGKAYAEGLIKDADLALYAAKAAGKGTFRFFETDMHAEAADRQILEADLRGALAKGQLRLLYQPIFDAVTEEVVAFEALIRWAHPTRGLLGPQAVIPIAEEAGLIGPIGDWALRTACAEAAKWPDHVRLAVNLSPMQFADPALAAILTGALASSQLDPDRLELEITEGVFQTESAAVDDTFARLKATGVRLALDNFGTGRSSLGHLRKAPLDSIKIDRSFVQGAAAAGSRNAAIIRAIVTLAESLGMHTTAEGAETHEDLELIRKLGCSQVQGFVFSPPVEAGEALPAALESKGGRSVSPDFSRPPRHRVMRRASITWNGRLLQARLRNISEGGAMVECDPIGDGEKVTLDLAEAGAFGAEVRWAKEGQVGLSFDEAFELGRLGRAEPPRTGTPSPQMLKPAYLDTEQSADSPWAGRRGKLDARDMRRR